MIFIVVHTNVFSHTVGLSIMILYCVTSSWFEVIAMPSQADDDR